MSDNGVVANDLRTNPHNHTGFNDIPVTSETNQHVGREMRDGIVDVHDENAKG